MRFNLLRLRSFSLHRFWLCLRNLRLREYLFWDFRFCEGNSRRFPEIYRGSIQIFVRRQRFVVFRSQFGIRKYFPGVFQVGDFLAASSDPEAASRLNSARRTERQAQFPPRKSHGSHSEVHKTSLLFLLAERAEKFTTGNHSCQ